MQTLTYGFKKPQVKDQGAIVFPALEANWQLVNDHDHDGSNSALIPQSAIFPAQAGNSGKVLSTNGSVVSWISFPQEIPSQSGQAGKFLTTDGSLLSWASVIGAGEVNTASNVGGGEEIFKQKSGVDFEFKTLVAGTNFTITPVGDTLVLASTGSGGANTSLSNLGTTAINADLLPASTGTRHLGANNKFWSEAWIDRLIVGDPTNFPTFQPAQINVGGVPTAYGPYPNISQFNFIAEAGGYGTILLAPTNNDGAQLRVLTGAKTTNTGKTQSILIGTGDSTLTESGDIVWRIGTSGTAQGKLKIQDASNGNGTTGAVGHVWTQTNADGSGAWQAAGGGGGGSGLFVRAEKTTGSSLGGAYGDVDLWTTKEDAANAFDLSTGIFTVPVGEGGDYLIAANIGTSVAADVVGLLLTKNGIALSDIVAANAGPVANMQVTSTLATTIKLVAGDTLRLRYYTFISAAYSTNVGINVFSIKKLDGGGSGGGINPNYQSTTLSPVHITVANTYLYSSATLTINPSGTEQWEIYYSGSVVMNSPSGSRFFASIGIFDSANALVDDALVGAGYQQAGFLGGMTHPVKLLARVTISSSQTYKIGVRLDNISSGNEAAIGYTDFSSLPFAAGYAATTGIDSGEKFFAKRVY